MKIKENGKEIPIRDSITEIISQGKNNPISVSTNIKNENEKSINLSFKDTYLFDNILSDTLDIEKNNEKISINTKNDGSNSQLKVGDGIKIDEDGKITIDQETFVKYKTINSDYLEWNTVGNYIYLDIKDDKQELIDKGNIDIFEPSSQYSWNTDEYVDLVNKNIALNTITPMKVNNTIFYPCTIKKDMVIGACFTYWSKNVSTVYVVCAKNNNMKFYATKPSFENIFFEDIM